MSNKHGIESTLGGYVCASCRGSYPSLYWFRRDSESGEAFCLDCSKSHPSNALEDVVEVESEGDVARKPWSLRRTIEALLEGLGVFFWEVNREAVLREAARFDQWLGRGLTRVALVAGVIFLVARLVWLAFDYLATRWPRFRKILPKDQDVQSP
jgi:hypothetical protein